MPVLHVGDYETANKGGDMTAHLPESRKIDRVLELLTEEGFAGMAGAIEILLNEAMKIERSAFLGAAPYERTDQREGYANGYKPKTVKSRLGKLELAIPQVRDVPEGCEGFYPKSLERGERSERALKLALAQMYVEGVSTRRVKAITEKLCGLEVSSSEVSRAAALLDEELELWRTRPLGEYRYLVLDARYEKVRHGGRVVSCAVLVAIGVGGDGRRAVLGVSVSLSEAEVHWREFLLSLKERGLHATTHITSDDHAGLKKAIAAVFPGVAWQRCQFHLQQNAQAYVPRVEMRKQVARDIRSIFNASSRENADLLLRQLVEKYRERAPKLAEWMEASIPEGLTVFDLPEPHRRRLRTSNVVERINREIKRRTRVATLFPNEASLLRLVSAILVEISEEWETGRKYLDMEAD